jgi:uncharacterized membrane protein YiaA
VDKEERRIDTLRIVGSVALLAGLLITVIGVAGDSVPARGYFLAGVFIVLGLGFRIEAALTRPRRP